MASYQIARVDLSLDLEKAVIIILTPEAVDVIWLIGIRFVLIGTAVRSDCAQRVHRFADMSVVVREELRRMGFRAIDVPG